MAEIYIGFFLEKMFIVHWLGAHADDANYH